MIRIAISAISIIASVGCDAAGLLTCATNPSTYEMMCFSDNAVRSNGDVRAAKLWRGGPKRVTETNFTARVHCKTGVLELTDRDGIAFARNRPEATMGKEFVIYICEHWPTKHDPNLSAH